MSYLQTITGCIFFYVSSSNLKQSEKYIFDTQGKDKIYYLLQNFVSNGFCTQHETLYIVQRTLNNICTHTPPSPNFKLYLNIMFKLELPYQENPAILVQVALKMHTILWNTFLFTLWFFLFDTLKYNSVLGVRGFFL